MGTYIPHTDDEVASMLAFLGLVLGRRAVRRGPRGPAAASGGWSWPTGVGEPDVLAHIEGLADRNRARSDRLVCFAGGGAYDHEIPSVTRALAGRSEFVTSYTPYQPEVAQGVLQAVFEYQTMVARLAGLPVANASLYDGGSAAVEAVNLGVAAIGPADGLGVGRDPSPLAPDAGHLRRRAPAIGWSHRSAGRRRDRTGPATPTGDEPPGVVLVGYPQLPRAASRTWPPPGRCATGPGRCWWSGSTRWPPGCSIGGRVGGRRGGGGGAGLRDHPRASAGPTSGCSPAAPTHVRRLPGPAGGGDGRRRGPHGLRHHPAGPGAGHPAGEGHLQRLHQPDPDGGDGGHPARWLGTVGLAELARGAPRPPATPATPLLALDGVTPFAGAPVLREFAVRLPSRPPWSSSGWPTPGFWPASPWGRSSTDGDRRPADLGDRAPDRGRDRRLRRPPWPRRWP